VGPPARFPARSRRHQRRVSQPAAAQWTGAPCRAGYPTRNAAKPDVANQTRRVRPAVPRAGRVPGLDGHGLMLIRNAEPEHIRTAPAVGAFPHRSACPAGQVAPPSLVESAGVAGRIGGVWSVGPNGLWSSQPTCAPDLRRKYAITPSSSLMLIRPLGCSPSSSIALTRRGGTVSSTNQEDGLQAPASLPASSR
jgi:hypothetical protein